MYGFYWRFLQASAPPRFVRCYEARAAARTARRERCARRYAEGPS
ncbi:hypothetical protein GCM10010249_51810 [Streptomyces roseolilacinus]|uniref:Uncharacterized protein n=1 Tax=Streptomyces roseolilacinus TaxID=66904 RepID=A0A918B4V8_9ACTN|nr:hypothetical protein GCM10010249_51810 [Streptomyces roseolilacinus]